METIQNKKNKNYERCPFYVDINCSDFIYQEFNLTTYSIAQGFDKKKQTTVTVDDATYALFSSTELIRLKAKDGGDLEAMSLSGNKNTLLYAKNINAWFYVIRTNCYIENTTGVDFMIIEGAVSKMAFDISYAQDTATGFRRCPFYNEVKNENYTFSQGHIEGYSADSAFYNYEDTYSIGDYSITELEGCNIRLCFDLEEGTENLLERQSDEYLIYADNWDAWFLIKVNEVNLIEDSVRKLLDIKGTTIKKAASKDNPF